MLAAFNDTWDWTAIGTLALAVVTLAAVIVAAVALRQTKGEIEISRREVEEAHRPVIVPLADRTSFMNLGADGASLERCPQLRPSGRLFVPVRNIGPGPALNIEVSVGLLDDAGDPTTAAPGGTPGRLAGLGELRSKPVLIELHGWGNSSNGDMPSFSLTVDYDDVAGKSWRTSCIYVVPTGRYDGMTINRVERQRPLSDLVRPVPPGAA
jgi:hypothetical protein